ncbi:hypothetical protein, partial [Staphylococcus saprophyticus]|uniref:hypothetical protein n=1 Tax=Staphylococcus saprophyticus TaxID=29385 RepID=UPI0021B2A00E
FHNFKQSFNKHIQFNTYQIHTTITSPNQTTLFIPNHLSSYNYNNINHYLTSILNYLIQYVSLLQSKSLVLFTT